MQGKKLFVGNLDYSTTQDELCDLFSKYGEVVSAQIIKNKGFGFVEMSNQAEAEKAQNELDNKEYKKRKLRVNEARDRNTGNRNNGNNRYNRYNRKYIKREGRSEKKEYYD